MAFGVAIIGGGIWAREQHTPAVLASKDLEVKAVFSRSLKSAQSVADLIPSKVDLYSDEGKPGFDDLLQREDIAAVILLLPIKNQNTYIRSALQAGKHVLSEKPVYENVKEAVELIKWYRSEIKGVTWCVAENFRYLPGYQAAAEEAKTLGRILGFQGRQHVFMPEAAPFYQTEWRKQPTHQGGFILDGGVHFMASMRQLLAAQPGNEIARISAFTHQLQKHLLPIDTADVILRTKSGISGTFQISLGTTLSEDEWTVACEKGWVKVEGSWTGSKVTVFRDGKETTKTIDNEKGGVIPEVRAWGEALAKGQVNKDQEPEAALADLELIESILRSGEQNGTPVDCRYQSV